MRDGKNFKNIKTRKGRDENAGVAKRGQVGLQEAEGEIGKKEE